MNPCAGETDGGFRVHLRGSRMAVHPRGSGMTSLTSDNPSPWVAVAGS